MTVQTPNAPSDGRTVEIDLPDPAATDRLGHALAQQIRTGDVIALSGDLGAGKSALARAAIRARLGDPSADVPSPTFTLVQTYDADGLEIWHIDLYRLSGPADAEELGLEEAYAHAVCLIEWPDRLGPALPPQALSISLEIVDQGRRATVVAPPCWQDRIAEVTVDAV